MQVIPTIIPTINLPQIKNVIDPTKVKVIPQRAIASDIIIAPLLPKVKFTLALFFFVFFKKKKKNKN